MHLKHSQDLSYCLSAAGQKKEDKFLLDLNIRLIIIVSALVMLFQVINLFESHTVVYPYLRLGSFILTAASALILIVLFIICRQIRDTDRIVIISYRFYIIILNICLTPFICRDADTTQIPINIVLLYFLLTLGPVFSQKENIIIVSITSFYNMIVVLLCGAKPLFAFTIAAGALTVIIKSDFFNKNYIRTIYRLQSERDTDELTGILNRRSGIESAATALSECIRYNKTCSVLIVDIDFFKNYNDCYGHIYGDEVLRIIAECITEQFNKKGNIVYRMGGEEFAVFAETDDSAEIIAEAKELQKRIAETETDFTRTSPLPTVSIGIMLYRPGTNTGEPFDLMSLVSEADCQLYNAKKSGRNIISHDNIIYR